MDKQHNAKKLANSSQQQRHNYSREGVNDPQVVPSQLPTHAAPKFPAKAPNASFSVVEKMKRKNVNISMWNFVATIPSQKKLLQ